MGEERIEARVEKLLDKVAELLDGSFGEVFEAVEVVHVVLRVFLLGLRFGPLLGFVDVEEGAIVVLEAVLAMNGRSLTVSAFDPDHSAEAGVAGGGIPFGFAEGVLLGAERGLEVGEVFAGALGVGEPELLDVDTFDEVEQDVEDDHVLVVKVVAHVGGDGQKQSEDILISECFDGG